MPAYVQLNTAWPSFFVHFSSITSWLFPPSGRRIAQGPMQEMSIARFGGRSKSGGSRHAEYELCIRMASIPSAVSRSAYSFVIPQMRSVANDGPRSLRYVALHRSHWHGRQPSSGCTPTYLRSHIVRPHLSSPRDCGGCPVKYALMS